MLEYKKNLHFATVCTPASPYIYIDYTVYSKILFS